ncbi:hypothetical protein HUN58_18495 [Curtobacterium sp. Csp1]|uniref:hypothetical protein n=1 Tax=Curtobacterium sp. Csp1 TaxID=2495429 RepID=UPI0015985E0C|nr:hypothetical protein [Curtobacterium sp. Csp1]QKS21650.1 hypothetical protein HUN58_18495 [Curtobacterium sp. Csp1]
MLTDQAIVAALRAAPPRDGYRCSDVRAEGGVLGVTFSHSGAPSARLEVRLPSTGAPQWWLFAPPEDADDWVSQFLVWTDEEVHTDGLGDSRERLDVDGVSHVVPTNYGWQLSDPREHARLTVLAGPFGWHDGGRTTWPDGSRSVPAAGQQHAGHVADRAEPRLRLRRDALVLRPGTSARRARCHEPPAVRGRRADAQRPHPDTGYVRDD